MIRRLNYTGRTKIHRSDIKLLTREADGALSFDAELRLHEYGLPPDAMVFIEAYRQTNWMRFPFGTIANLQAPPVDARVLTEFDSAEELRFRVKVTQAENEHILLAVADRVPLGTPSDPEGRESLLPVCPADLGDELWQVDLEDEPTLLVNKFASSDWRQLAQSPLFVALVYPAVLRIVLRSILADDFRDTDDEADWRSRWLHFAASLPSVDPHPPDIERGPEAAFKWAEDAVSAFANLHSLKEKFIAAWQPKGAL